MPPLLFFWTLFMGAFYFFEVSTVQCYLVHSGRWTCNSGSGSSQLRNISCRALWPCVGAFVLLSHSDSMLQSSNIDSTPQLTVSTWFLLVLQVCCIHLYFMNDRNMEPLIFVSCTEATVLSLRDPALLLCLFWHNFGHFVSNKVHRQNMPEDRGKFGPLDPKYLNTCGSVAYILPRVGQVLVGSGWTSFVPLAFPVFILCC